MHARRLDAAHQLDGARKLAFNGADTRHFLHEGCEAKGAKLVEELVPGVGIGGQALFGQGHARLSSLSIRHEHRSPVSTHIK